MKNENKRIKIVIVTMMMFFLCSASVSLAQESRMVIEGASTSAGFLEEDVKLHKTPEEIEKEEAKIKTFFDEADRKAAEQMNNDGAQIQTDYNGDINSDIQEEKLPNKESELLNTFLNLKKFTIFLSVVVFVELLVISTLLYLAIRKKKT